MKTIEKIIQPNAVWVHPTQNVKTAIVILKAYNLTIVPVLENKKLVGIALWKNLVNIE